jgi:Putative peptidoglycan binding domain
MVEDRVARGHRLRGHHRLRSLPILALALVCAAALAGPASAASGGASVGSPSHSRAKSKKAKKVKRRPHRLLSARAQSRLHAARRSRTPLAGRAMWIWELPYTNGGNLSSIIASAKRYGVGTLLIKSSDGTSEWSQFTPQLVSALHANGLRVCAWQYVYGSHPVTEAYMGAAAVRDGADCLVIDAESEYEGKYIAAQSYIGRLRKLIGFGYPLALAGFPYIDYHPGFPYSVFLGPGGAQFNAPQMYWKDIGVSVDAVFAHTYSYNLIYGRPIYPLGQVYSRPPVRQIVRFRQLSRAYGASGLSWWDWQEATDADWIAVSRPAGDLPGYVPYTAMATIQHGYQGDLAVWAQEHLISAGYAVGVDGGFGAKTESAVKAFQTAHGLTPDGIIGPATWQALLRYRTARVVWGRHHHLLQAKVTSAIAAAGGVIYAPVPKSASRPAKRDEIAGAGGSGGLNRRSG